jgi:hypothetical protein
MPEFFVGKMIFSAVDICIKKDGQSRPVLVAQKNPPPRTGVSAGWRIFDPVFKRTKRGKSS